MFKKQNQSDLGLCHKYVVATFERNLVLPLREKTSKLSFLCLVYDLKNHKSSTLPIESRFNFTTLSLSPNGILLIAVDEDGEVSVISLISRSIVHKLRTNRQILDVSFSPDGKRFAFTKENFVQVCFK